MITLKSGAGNAIINFSPSDCGLPNFPIVMWVEMGPLSGAILLPLSTLEEIQQQTEKLLAEIRKK